MRRKLPGVAVTVKPEGDGRQALVLGAEPVAVAEARAWLSSLTAVLVVRPRRSDLELVVSEIVTNAVRHGRKGGEILLAATPKQDFVCVQVTARESSRARAPWRPTKTAASACSWLSSSPAAGA